MVEKNHSWNGIYEMLITRLKKFACQLFAFLGYENGWASLKLCHLLFGGGIHWLNCQVSMRSSSFAGWASHAVVLPKLKSPQVCKWLSAPTSMIWSFASNIYLSLIFIKQTHEAVALPEKIHFSQLKIVVGRRCSFRDGLFGKLLWLMVASIKPQNWKEKQMVPIYNSLVVFEVEEGQKVDFPSKKRGSWIPGRFFFHILRWDTRD